MLFQANNLFLDFINKFINDSFVNFGTDVVYITIADVIIMLFWSIVLSFIIAMTYRGTHRSVSYSQSFTQTLILLNVIVSAVMLIVGTDIARAFTLVGALSIVRFRTAIKDPRDIGFIFFTMVVGMGCGTRFYLLGIIVTLVLCALIYFMTYIEFGKKELSQDILELQFPTSQDYNKILSPIFMNHLKYYSILGIDSVDDNNNRLSFLITFKKKSKIISPLKKKRGKDIDEYEPRAALLNEIQVLKYIHNVKIIEGSSSIEI